LLWLPLLPERPFLYVFFRFVRDLGFIFSSGNQSRGHFLSGRGPARINYLAG
jgi:hypothetical protein